ncbi:MAG: type I CRISPR-associated protein Cas8a1/Csx8 [Lachnospirales bacterium]
MSKLDFDEKYDSMAETSDWRYSAAIVGLKKYLDFFNLDYETDYDFIYYNEADITEDRFLEFAERYFKGDMHHIAVENFIKSNSDFDDDKIKEINGRLTGNTVMKKYFSKNKFNGKNGEDILKLIEENRWEIVKETFRNKSNFYAGFNNTNSLFQDKKDCSRVLGYYVDMPKKGKALSYNFDTSKFISTDDKIFDFIPFAFTIGRNSVFINDNSSIESLVSTSAQLEGFIDDRDVNVRQKMFEAIAEGSDLIDFDVEVIFKNRNNDYFETMFLRKKSIDIIRKIKDYYKCFYRFYKVNDNYFIDVSERVIMAIVNLTNVNDLINIFLNEDNPRLDGYKNSFIINKLIELNILIKGDEKMANDVFFAQRCAKEISKNKYIDKNKVKSYRTKLTSALIFKDYSRFCQILMQLANVTEADLDFAYKLFENFEENENIAYAFINGLGDKIDYSKEKKED